MKSRLLRRFTPLAVLVAMSLGVVAGADVLASAGSSQSDLLQAIIAPRA